MRDLINLTRRMVTCDVRNQEIVSAQNADLGTQVYPTLCPSVSTLGCNNSNTETTIPGLPWSL